MASIELRFSLDLPSICTLGLGGCHFGFSLKGVFKSLCKTEMEKQTGLASLQQKKTKKPEHDNQCEQFYKQNNLF